MDFKPSITGFTRVIPLVPILFELIYVAFSLIGVPQLLLTIISFPAMFILPGTLLLAVLEKRGGFPFSQNLLLKPNLAAGFLE